MKLMRHLFIATAIAAYVLAIIAIVTHEGREFDAIMAELAFLHGVVAFICGSAWAMLSDP